MKTKIIVTLFMLVFAFSLAKADDFKDAILKAKKNLNTAINSYEEKDLLKSRGEFERILQLKQNEWIIYYYIAYIDYNLGYTGSKDGKQDNEIMKKYNSSAWENINKAIELKDDFADSYVLKYGINFNRFMYEMDKMMEIVGTSKQLGEKVESLDKENPRYFYLKGASAYYTPDNYGGGAETALQFLEKANTIYETRIEKEEYYPDWGRDQNYGFLAMSYNKLGQKDKAKQAYDKGVELCPNSNFLLKYVKGELEK